MQQMVCVKFDKKRKTSKLHVNQNIVYGRLTYRPDNIHAPQKDCGALWKFFHNSANKQPLLLKLL